MCAVEILNEEWRSFLHFDIKHIMTEDIVEFWHTLMQTQNVLEEFLFKNLSEYMLTLIVLPHSSASAERYFSEMNLTKTAIRNRLSVSTVNDCMFAKNLLKGNSIYEPPQDLLKYIRKFNFKDGYYESK